MLVLTMLVKDAFENEAIPMQDRFITEQLVSEALVNVTVLLRTHFSWTQNKKQEAVHFFFDNQDVSRGVAN